MANGEEKRRTPRISAKVPLKVVPTDGPAHHPENTESINLSERGLYFQLPGGFKTGSTIEIAFTMPGEVTGGMPMKVRCTARITRVEAQRGSDSRVGVAAHIERFESVVGEG